MPTELERAQEVAQQCKKRFDDLTKAAELLKVQLPLAQQACDAAQARLQRLARADADQRAASRAHELSQLQKQIQEARHGHV